MHLSQEHLESSCKKKSYIQGLPRSTSHAPGQAEGDTHRQTVWEPLYCSALTSCATGTFLHLSTEATTTTTVATAAKPRAQGAAASTAAPVGETKLWLREKTALLPSLTVLHTY